MQHELPAKQIGINTNTYRFDADIIADTTKLNYDIYLITIRSFTHRTFHTRDIFVPIVNLVLCSAMFINKFILCCLFFDLRILITPLISSK